MISKRTKYGLKALSYLSKQTAGKPVLISEIATTQNISQKFLESILLDLKKKGIGIFLTDHNVRETLRAVDRAYLLYDGSVLTHGDAPFLLSDPQAREKYLGTDFEA